MTSQGPADRAGLLDGLKLGAGTFTAIRVPPPNQVDQRSWKVALLTAPFWGAILGVLAAIPGLAGWWLAGQFDTRTGLAAAITGGLSVAAYALLTRGLHLDGVADTFDGFGSARTGAAALAVMKDPALGALGGVAVVLVVLLQVAAWGQLLTSGSAISGVLAVGAAMVLARAPLMWMTRAGTPAADTGLGRAVVGASGNGAAVVVGGIWTMVAAGLLVTAGVPWIMTAVAAVSVWALGERLRRAAISRFGVVNGDVLGTVIEIGGTAALVLLALAGR